MYIHVYLHISTYTYICTVSQKTVPVLFCE